MEEGKLSTNQYVIAAFICLVSYGIMFFLNAARNPLGQFVADANKWELAWIYTWIPNLLIVPSLLESPMFLVMPFVGFAAIFLLVDWANKNFETKFALSPLFLLLFFVLALVAYYVALYWYMSNFALLEGIPMGPELVDFWGRLHISAFLLFFWGGVFGWIARFAVEKIDL